MTKPCLHTELEKLELEDPPSRGEICHRDKECPSCHKLLSVEYIKTIPMVDDIELSPKWYPRAFEEA